MPWPYLAGITVVAPPGGPLGPVLATLSVFAPMSPFAGSVGVTVDTFQRWNRNVDLGVPASAPYLWREIIALGEVLGLLCERQQLRVLGPPERGRALLLTVKQACSWLPVLGPARVRRAAVAALDAEG